MTDVVMDLRGMCQGIRPLLLDRSATPGAPRTRVEPLPGTSRHIDPDAVLPVAGYVDGVQATRLLTIRDDRPVYVVGTGAGLMDPACRRVRHALWRIALLCSHRDEQWARTLPELPCELVILEANHADGLDLGTHDWTDATRRQLEAETVATALVEHPERWAVLDGSLRDLSQAQLGNGSPKLVGVVKTCQRQYLNDEHREVHPLRVGEMSRTFLLPAQRRDQLDRASCYLRQHERGYQPWTFGLVRLEVPAQHVDLLPTVAATVLAGRQHPGSGDARWDRQQAWIARLESALHSALPYPLRP